MRSVRAPLGEQAAGEVEVAAGGEELVKNEPDPGIRGLRKSGVGLTQLGARLDRVGQKSGLKGRKVHL